MARNSLNSLRFMFTLLFASIFSNRALSISEKNKVDADNYHYFSYDNKDGTAGVAATMRLFANSDALGSVCWRNQRERTAISEWLNDEATTALVIYLKK